MGRPREGITAEDRFWSHVRKTRRCWLWEGYSANGRYGHLEVSGERKGAHVYSWELHNGPIPAGMKVLHRCDEGFCINPRHLFLGTQKDNAVDCSLKGRCGNQKLKPADIRRIRKMKPQIAAAKFGVHLHHVHAIQRGVYHKEVV